MKRIILRINEANNEKKTKIKSFSPLKNNTCMAFGMDNGVLQITNLTENYKCLLKIEVFNIEIKYICELDENILAASDGKNEIKIIQWEEEKENSKYSIIQTIHVKDYIDSMNSLPLLSSNNHYHYLCIANENNIFIYKSNKVPKFLNIPDNTDDNLQFTLLTKIQSDTLIHSLIEINERYLAAACPNTESIKIFDMNNNFIKYTEINGINSTRGSNIFLVLPQKNLLIVACNDGFKYISTIKMRKIKSVHCRYSVLCVDFFKDNIFICSCNDKNKNKIKQYKINDFSYELDKISERASKNNDEIWKLKKVNERIFFLDDQNNINFLSLL